jgi:PD-(D/E)XK nuclease superfamily
VTLPVAAPLTRLAPSSYEIVRTCPLRLAFRQAGPGPGPQSPAARVGDACHKVLEALVAEGDLQTDVWKNTVDERFAAAIAQQEAASGGPLRGARLARARLRKVAQRMSSLLYDVPREALFPEQELEAAEGRLWGTIDLVVRAAGGHFIADYKTGSFVDAITGSIKERYRRQLMLYACLEHAAASWPDAATIIPFTATPLSIDIDPAKCLEVLDDLLSALDEWQSWVGHVPPANVAPDACAWCPYATRCDPFWDSCNPEWDPAVTASRGRVESVSSSPLGGVTLRLESTAGSVLGALTIRNADPDEHPRLSVMEAGAEISIVGLRPSPSEDAYTLRPGARVQVVASTPNDGTRRTDGDRAR